MPARSSWPNSGDLLRFLEGAGLTVPSALNGLLATAAAAGRRDLEGPKGADRKLLADAEDVERRFDPPTDRGSLLFIPDLAELTTLEYQPENATAETLTANEDFWLEPYDAQADPDQPQPFTQIRFYRRWRMPLGISERRSIVITGKWGYAATLPDDIWLAALAHAGCLMLPGVAQNTTGGVLEWKDADAAEKYGDDPFKMLRTGWELQFQLVAQAYRRLVI